MSTQTELRRQVTDRIVQALDSCVRPWANGTSMGLPRNGATGKHFSGANALLLNLTAMERGYRSNRWLTWEQAEGLSHVIGGWHDWMLDRRGTQIMAEERGGSSGGKIPFLREQTVYHMEEIPKQAIPETFAYWGIDADVTVVEELAAATGADIRFEGRGAWYFYPPNDYILCPPRQIFVDYPAFASTVTHELTHWTEPRLGWQGSTEMNELRAEIVSGLLMTELGIPPTDKIRNHEKYLDRWLAELRQDHTAIFRVAAGSTQACECLMRMFHYRPRTNDARVSTDQGFARRVADNTGG